MRKKIGMAALLLVALLLGGCAQQPESEKLSVITAIFPAYDWTRAILGDTDRIELTMLTETGVDLHSYQATVEDMVRLAQCDLFVYVGGESDAWVADVLTCVPNELRQELPLMELLEGFLHEEETVEGMQVRGLEEESNEPEFDEHVWLSVRNAEVLVSGICEAVCTLDPDNAQTYQANAAGYLAQLAALDAAFAEAAAQAQRDTLLFCDRFPFRYLVEDYGLKYYAAFSGCSADSAASFATVLFLAEKAQNQHTLLILEDSDGMLAHTVRGCAAGSQSIRVLDSMQAVSMEQVRAGKTYLQTMTENFAVLEEALR